MPLRFQDRGNSFEQTPETWQALPLAGPVYFADISLSRAFNTTCRPHGPGSVRAASHPTLTVCRPAPTVAGNRPATTDARSVSFCCGGWGVRFASPSRVPPPSLALIKIAEKSDKRYSFRLSTTKFIRVCLFYLSLKARLTTNFVFIFRS